MLEDLIKSLWIVKDLMDDSSLRVEDVIKIISLKGGASPEDILGKSRPESVVFLRQAAYYIYKEKFGMTYSDISRLTNKDRSTVIYGVRNIKRKLKIYSGNNAAGQDARTRASIQA